MYLKKIEIYGFKSFANKVELTFENGITAVVGPNGSGKSNIADAVRWVLGEQSMKSLRGSKMEDVIFSGTQKRKPLGYAEVSLVIDNQSGKLPIDYNEVKITRRVFRSGESEFYINKSSCRLKDIHELFMDTGLGKEGYSIVGQGRIDEILSASVQDRRYIFEEAAGIVKYKARKNEAEKKLDKTQQNLIRIVDIIHELEQQESPLLKQSHKAKEYLKISEKLKELELSLFIHKIDDIKEKQYKLETDKSNQLHQIQAEEEEIRYQDQIYNELKKQARLLDEEINNHQEQLYQLKTDGEKSLGAINVLENQMEHLTANKARIAQEIIKFKKTLIQKREKKKEMEDKIQNIQEFLDKKAKIHRKVKDKYNSLKKSSMHKEISIDRKNQEKIKLMNDLSDFKSSLNGMKIMGNNVQNQMIQMKGQLNQLKINIKEKNMTLEELQRKTSLKTQDLTHLTQIKQNADIKLTESIKQAEKLHGKFQQLTNKIQMKQSRINILNDMEKEYEGYYKSVKNLMIEKRTNSTLNNEIYGVVAELINVPTQYVHSIETALSSALQYIVVKNEITAQRCIEILNKKRWGRATFLPLEVIKGAKIEKELELLKKHQGFVGIASDLVYYDSIFTPIINQLLGRVIVVHQMKDGIYLSRKLNHRYKIVTLEGEVFNPGGSMVGGSRYKTNTGILSRVNEIKALQSKLEKLNNSYDEINSSIQEVEKHRGLIEEEIEKHTEAIKNIEMEMITLNNQSQQMKFQKETTQDEMEKTIKHLEMFNSESIELKAEENQAEENIIKVDSKIRKITHEINIFQGSHQENKEKLEALNNEITQLEVAMAQLQQQLVDSKGQLVQTVVGIEQFKNEIGEKEMELKHCTTEINTTHQSIKELQNRIENLSKIKQEKKIHINQLIEDKKTLGSKKEKNEDKLKEYNKQTMVSSNALHKIEIQLSKIEIAMKNLQNRISEEYHLTYDLALGFKKEIGSEAQAIREIEKIKEQIKNLGNVNLDSIQEYEKVSARLSFLKEQREDLYEAKDNLHDIITDILTSMEKQFIEQFDVIKVKFNEVFQQLFQGGYANIYLVEPQSILTSGIEIEVQPPGKKLQSLSLLSGGERALTAIALLFAILKIKPTPFCILDEIEAALDDANVKRYARFLKEFSLETQFIAVTHRKGTMESADVLYGVTMEEQGVSKLVSVKLSEIAS